MSTLPPRPPPESPSGPPPGPSGPPTGSQPGSPRLGAVAGPPPSPPRPQRRRLWLILGGAFCVLAVATVVVILSRGGNGRQPAAGPAPTDTAPTIPTRITPPQQIGAFVLQPNPTLDSDRLLAGFSAGYKRESPAQFLTLDAHHLLAPQDSTRSLTDKIRQRDFQPGASTVTLTSAGIQFTCTTGRFASSQGTAISACVWPTGSIVFAIALVPASDPQSVIALAPQAQTATGS